MKVVVGTNTIVKKITVGTPIRIGTAANGSLTGLDDVNGSVNLSDGSILQYDSNSGKFIHVSPTTITGSGLGVTDAGGLGSVGYDSALAVLTYTGPSSDSVHSLFNATYDSNSLGTLSYTDGTVRLVGPTDAQIRNLFSAGNDLTYNAATGEFSVNVPDTSAAFDSNFGLKTTTDLPEGSNLYYTDSRGRSAISVVDAGGFGSIGYNSPTGEITYTGPSVSDMRGTINVGANLAYDSATGKITFTGVLNPPPGDGGTALTVVTSGDYGSLSYDQANAVLTHVGVNDSNIRGAITATGDLTYNSTTGELGYTERSDADIRSLFSGSNDVTYNPATGEIDVNVGPHYDDADARQAITVNDLGGSGSLSYNNSTGVITYQGATDSSVRATLSASGDISYDQNTGIISFTERTDAQIRSLFNVSGDLGYDTATGVFSVDLGSVDVTDSAVTRALFSVTNDAGDYGSLAYDAASGQFAFTKVTDSDIRSSISAGGDLSYDQTSGVITYNKRTDADIRSLFTGAGDITYNNTTGEFSLTVGAHYEDSDARHAIDFLHNADSVNNIREYGAVDYNKSTGLVTIFGTRDSDIRGSLTVHDSGGLGSLSYNEKQGRIVYRGAGVDSLFSMFSVNEDPTSLGDLYLDSATGSIRFQLDQDSIRQLISVVSDNEGGTHLSYNPVDGVITFRGPSTLEVRDLIMVDSLANYGDGSLVYHESSGVFTYIGPVAAETRKHFDAGLGLDYDSGTGTYRIDSTSNSIMNSLRADSAVSTPLLHNETDNITIEPQSANASDSAGLVAVKGSMRIFNDLTVNGSFNVTGDDAVFNVSALSVEDAAINIGKDIPTNTNGIDGAGLIFGTDSANGTGPLEFLFNYDSNRWQLNRGLNIDGTLIANNIISPTTLSLQQQIDALPDSAESRNLLSAGPGLTYDNVLGIYRITSSGVVAGTYGTLNKIPQFAVDSLGQIDSISEIQVSVVENFQFDSTSGNLKITTATDSYNVGFTLDPYSTFNLVEDPNATPNTGTQYYTDARVDSNLSSGRSSPIVRTGDITGVTLNATGPTSPGDNAAIGYTAAGGLILAGQGSGYDVTIKNDADSDVLRVPTGSKEVQLTGFLSGPEEFIIDPAAVGDNTGTVRILGNLTVEGIQTTINSTTISLNDKNIVIADSAGDSAALDGSGITFGGTNIGDTPTFQYSHTGERFAFNRDITANRFYGDVTGQITSIGNHTTADLAEDSFATVNGGTMYFTQARARSSINFVDAGGDGSFVYDSANGTMTYTGPSPVETRAHFQVNDTGGDGALSYDSASGKFTYVGPSPAETRAHLNVLDAGGDGSFGYDSALGKFTYTGPSPAETRAHFQVNDTGGDGSLAYDSATGKITYTGPSEAEWYQHFVDNADSFGDMVWDSNYGTKGGLALHERHILKYQEVFADSFINSQEFFLYYSGTLGEMRKVSADTLAAKVGGAGGGAGGGLLSYVNL